VTFIPVICIKSCLFYVHRNLDPILRIVGMRWTTEELWFDSRKGQEIFLCLVSHWLWGPPNGFRTGGDFSLEVIGLLLAPTFSTVTRRLTTRILSEKCFVRRFRRCANVIECTYTKLDSVAYYTPRLYGIAYCSYATNILKDHRRICGPSLTETSLCAHNA
jgi:hypothetical protein